MGEVKTSSGNDPKTPTGIETARRFFTNTSSTYDPCVRLWTLGADRWWKKEILGLIPPSPKNMIDQACGTGILTLIMARRFPLCRFIGVDLHREYLALAARKAEARNVHNVQWVQGRAEDVVLKGPYDCITSSYLAKYADLDRLVLNAKRMLAAGGVLVMHDFTYPRSRLSSDALGLHFRIMKTVGSRAFPQWKIVFHELEDFLKRSRWVSELMASLEKNGFRSIRLTSLTLGFAAVVSAVKM